MVRRRSPRVHERVLEAALALFAERGMVGTSMDAIAEASSVSKATIPLMRQRRTSRGKIV